MRAGDEGGKRRLEAEWSEVDTWGGNPGTKLGLVPGTGTKRRGGKANKSSQSSPAQCLVLGAQENKSE